MIDIIFDVAVRLLLLLADLLGMSYEAVNVWLFVILWPLFTLGLVGVVVRQRWKLKRLKGGGR